MMYPDMSFSEIMACAKKAPDGLSSKTTQTQNYSLIIYFRMPTKCTQIPVTQSYIYSFKEEILWLIFLSKGFFGIKLNNILHVYCLGFDKTETPQLLHHCQIVK